MHSNLYVCCKKAALYLEVENHYCVSSAARYTIDAQEAVANVDENTKLIGAILWPTFTGEYEDVQALNNLFQEKNDRENLDVYIHVDATSGGFVVPFVEPDFSLALQPPLSMLN